MKKIIAFSGSNSSRSINQQLIQIVGQFVEGAEVEIISLREYSVPIYCLDDEESVGYPASMLALHDKLQEADGYIVASPEHNGSMPAVFKNAIDWLSRIGRKVFNNKPTVFLSATPGGRAGASVLEHIERIMPHQGAQLVGVYGVGRWGKKVVEGQLIDADDVAALRALVAQLEAQL